MSATFALSGIALLLVWTARQAARLTPHGRRPTPRRLIPLIDYGYDEPITEAPAVQTGSHT